MTGRYTIRLGTQSNVIWWDSPWGIPLNETFMPENLKDAGYITAMFGKVQPLRAQRLFTVYLQFVYRDGRVCTAVAPWHVQTRIHPSTARFR